MQNLIRWFSRNHVAANFVVLAVFIGGIVGWISQKKEIFPETSINAVSIRIPYPNATPEEVEKGVVIPVEEAIADVEGIERISSTSAEGYGVVTVEVANNYLVREIMDDLKTRVDAIDNFAENAERPEMEELKIKREVMSVTVSADTDENTLRKFGERVRDGLLASGDITQAELTGVRPYEISIEVPEQTLRAHGLTFEAIASAIRRASVDLPGGSVRGASGEILIRTSARKYSAREIGDITVLTRPDGSTLRVSDVATVIDGFEEDNVRTRFDGRPAVVVNVFRVGNEDTLRVAKAVRDYIADARDFLPAGVTLEIWNDTSVYLKGRMGLLAKNAGIGFVLVLTILALFMRPSLAFFVALGIPASFAGGLMLMPWLGVSINMISLFAFIMVLGIVVDDALVAGENVYTRMQAGEHPREAAWKGTHEVAVVVIFGVLTTVAAFTPMLMLSGVSGKIWPNIPLVVIPVLLFSLAQCFLVLPAHLASLKPYRKQDDETPVGRVLHAVETGLHWFIDHVYTPVLRLATNARYVTGSVFLAMILLTVGIIGAGWVKTSFFPKVEADIISASVTMPRGAAFEETSAAVERMEKAAMELGGIYKDRAGNPVVVHLLATAGTQPFQTSFQVGSPKANNIGQVTIELRPAAGRDVKADELAAKWRELTGGIPGAVDLKFQTLAAGGGLPIDVEISGDNLVVLDQAVNHVKEKLAGFNGVTDISDSDLEGKREIRLTGLTAEGKSLGLRLEDVARQLRQGFYGDEAQRLQRGRDEVKVMVRYPKSERETAGDLESVRIRLADGSEVPLARVATFDYGRGYSVIQRADRKRSIRVTADIDKSNPDANANEVVATLTNETLVELPKRFPGTAWNFQGEQRDQRNAMEELQFYGLLALLAIYILLAIPLRSYTQPIIVMAVIPFGIIGAVGGHVLLGLELSIMSMCGIVALAGMVVNDSLVLVDYVNRMRAKGESLHEAALQAGRKRFRAVLLTTLTTVAGLAPMVFEKDIQGQFLIPMAVSLAAGIAFATVITLLLVPCVYLIMEDVRALLFRPEKVREMDDRFRREHEEDEHYHALPGEPGYRENA